MESTAADGAAPARQIGDLHRGLLVAAQLVLAAVLAGLVLGLLYVVSVAFGQLSMNVPPLLQEWDTALFRWMNRLQDPATAKYILMLLNDPGLDYTLVIAPCLGYLWARRRGETLFAAAALGATLIFGAWTSPWTTQFGFRHRPFVDIPDAVVDDFWRQIWVTLPTFPSGHLRELSGMTTILIYFWPRAGLLAVPYLLGVSFTRVYLGAHYPLDVGAGIVLGMLSGTVSLVVVSRLRRMIVLAREISWVRFVYRRVLNPSTAPNDPLVLRLARCCVYFPLVLGAVALLGYPIHTEQPVIIFAYMRNVDNSILNPIFGLFDPQTAGTMYWILGNTIAVGSGLSLLILGRSVVNGRGAVLRVVVALAICFGLFYLLGQLAVLQHSRPRPFDNPGTAIAESWRLLWPGVSTYPDVHVVLVSGLAAILASTWRRLSPLAYVYLLPVAVGMLYFGAVWPTQVVVSLVVGYLCGRYAIMATAQLIPLAPTIKEPWPAGRR